MRKDMNRLFILPLLLLLLQSGCSQRPPLSGKLEFSPDGDWGNMVYLIQPRMLDEVAASYTGAVIDSAEVQADGSFAFEQMPDTPESILLELVVQRKKERFLNRLDNDDPLMANYFPIIWKNGESLEVVASVAQFQRSFAIKKPSPENAALLELRDIRQAGLEKLLTQNHSEAHDEAALLEKEAAVLDFQKPLMDFAEQSNDLLPALMAIRWVSPENDFERIPEFLYTQCEKWKAQNADHPWVVQLCEKGNREQLPILQGDPLPDASLPMLAGDTSTLYQLLGERLTILDLWASWCAPCRRENRDVLVPVWSDFHEKGLQIIGYSLDGSENAWKKAIEKDGAYRWVHASHLQGDDAPFLQTLRLQTIPANFILDAHGTVLKKNLHGADLVRFVEEYMGR